MCLTANASLIEQSIDELTSASPKGMFSAYDITRMAKAKGATEYHSQMKGHVHAQYAALQQIGYTRTLIPTPTGDTWLYHEVGADIQPYIDRLNPNGVNALPSPNSLTALPSPNTAPAAPSLTATATVTTGAQRSQDVDAEGRLPIYPDMLGYIKAEPGNDVHVYKENKSLIVSKNLLSLATPIAHYSVNADGRIRIAADTLQSTRQTYTIKYNSADDVLTVE